VDDKHGRAALAEHGSGHAAEYRTLNTGAAMAGHHHHIGETLNRGAVGSVVMSCVADVLCTGAGVETARVLMLGTRMNSAGTSRAASAMGTPKTSSDDSWLQDLDGSGLDMDVSCTRCADDRLSPSKSSRAMGWFIAYPCGWEYRTRIVMVQS